MGNVFIMNYKGFDIEFNTDNSKFFSCIKGEHLDNNSFEEVKKSIDYCYDENFCKFFLREKNKLDVIVPIVGITKAGYFVTEIEGRRNLIDRSREAHYVIYNEEDEPIVQEIQRIKDKITELGHEISIQHKRLKGESVSDYRKKHLKEEVKN